jgi:DNA-directed RNA polymerase subunit H (RpoH/RPB5)
MDLLDKFTKKRQYTAHDIDQYLFKDVSGQLVYIDTTFNKLDMNYFKHIQKHLNDQCAHIIFIYTSTTLSMCNLRNYQSVLKIELFEYNELHRLLIGNRFTPAYRILSPTEVHQVLSVYNRDHLPQLCKSDPIARLNDLSVGAILEVDRGDSLIYRIVLE